MDTDNIGTAMARRCSTEALLAALNERGFEAVPNTVGPAVQAVIAAHGGLKREKLGPVDPAQVAFEEAVTRLLVTLVSTDPHSKTAAE